MVVGHDKKSDLVSSETGTQGEDGCRLALTCPNRGFFLGHGGVGGHCEDPALSSILSEMQDATHARW